MVGNGIMHGKNIQWWFSGPTPTNRKSSAPIANSSSDNSWLESISPLTLSLTRPPGSSSMVTKTSLSPTSASLLSSPIKFSYHKSNEVVGPSTVVLLDPAKVQGRGGTRESAQAAHQNHPLAANSTKHLGANGLTVDSPINAPIVHQAVTPNPPAHAKQGRDPMIEVTLRGKRPCYMCFIFRVNDASRTPSAVGRKMVQCISHLWRLVSVIGICCYYRRSRIPS